jgi:hypothetical protein
MLIKNIFVSVRNPFCYFVSHTGLEQVSRGKLGVDWARWIRTLAAFSAGKAKNVLRSLGSEVGASMTREHIHLMGGFADHP